MNGTAELVKREVGAQRGERTRAKRVTLKRVRGLFASQTTS